MSVVAKGFGRKAVKGAALCASLLPDKPSDLLACALGDLIRVERSRDYRINMGTWYSGGPGACEVCMAGSVIVGTLGMRAEAGGRAQHPSSLLDRALARKLRAINLLRIGDIGGACGELGVTKPARCPSHWLIHDYTFNPPAFKRDMRVLIKLLRTHGI